MIVIDQIGCQVELLSSPQRIISLVPSQTELLFDLGLKERIVGVTKFCIHPRSEVKGKLKIGGTKNFNFQRIEELQPDLIIANKEENYKEGVEQLEKKHPVWTSDIKNLKDAFEMIEAVGLLTNTQEKSEEIRIKIDDGFEKLAAIEKRRRAIYLIWKDPYMSVGTDTFINEMLHLSGFDNLLKGEIRYPEIDTERIRNLNPEVILLSSEPYPFKAKHLGEFRAICPEAKVELVDGEMFSWYGSRLQLVPEYFLRLNKELVSS